MRGRVLHSLVCGRVHGHRSAPPGIPPQFLIPTPRFFRGLRHGTTDHWHTGLQIQHNNVISTCVLNSGRAQAHAVGTESAATRAAASARPWRSKALRATSARSTISVTIARCTVRRGRRAAGTVRAACRGFACARRGFWVRTPTISHESVISVLASSTLLQLMEDCRFSCSGRSCSLEAWHVGLGAVLLVAVIVTAARLGACKRRVKTGAGSRPRDCHSAVPLSLSLCRSGEAVLAK